ncbi:MAG: glycosyltransferase family 39 protein [Candidatus Levybacteria bacterium]|nr:glycosyltransferase family 39 protein [Candidatus Levybacteria bacterium]
MRLVKKIKSDKKFSFFVIGVLFTAFFLRFFKLTSVPFGMHRDEIINVYVGRFILQNGADPYNNLWPLFYFDKFGDFPPIMPMYIMGLSTLVLGVNEFAMRAPAALFGALTVIPVYFLSYQLFQKKYPALLSAFLLAILPWHIVLSRMSAEGILAVFAFATGLVFLLKGVFNAQKKALYIALPFLLITYFLYPSFRILIPLSIFPLLLVRKTRLIITAMLVLFVIVTLSISSTDWGRARFNQTSVFTSSEVSNTIAAMTQDEGHNDALLARVFHNKPIGYSREFARQYFSYFSPNFLFMNGSTPHEYIIPDVGLIYIVFFVLCLGVLLPVSVKYNKSAYYYFLYLLLVSVIPAALTIDFPPHVHRALVMTIPIVILLPLGLLKILEVVKRKNIVLVLFFGILLLECIYFSHQYFNHISSYKSLFKNDGFREAAAYADKNKSKYERVYVPSFNLPYFYLFYTNNFNKDLAGKFKMKQGQSGIDSVGNIQFLAAECPSDELQKKLPSGNILILDFGICNTPPGFTQIDKILRQDNSEAFKILEVSKK